MIKKLLLSLALLASPVTAQWGPIHTIDTGFFTPNTYGHTPENEPSNWSIPLSVPLPPDGTDYVRITITQNRYDAIMECTNLSPLGWISYVAQGTYDYHVGHRPGLYAESTASCAFPQWLVGSGWDSNAAHSASILNKRSGGSGIFNSVAMGDTTTELLPYTDNGGVDIIIPITPEWLVPNRRGQHSLYVTAEGGYNITWYVHNANGDFIPPAEVDAMFSHNPWSYSLTPRVSLRATIRYANF